MLDFSQFNQLTNLSDLKSHQATKSIVLPKDLKHRISYKALLSEATWSDLGDNVNVVHFFKDQSCYFSYVDEFALIDSTEIHDVLMIDYDEDDREEFVATFENRAALEIYLKNRLHFPSDAVYLELNDQAIEELAAKTREAQLKFYDEKISRMKWGIARMMSDLKDLEDAKEELMNEIR